MEEVTYVRVSVWVFLGDRVVHIPAFLPPWIEHNFFIGMVRVDGGDDPLDGIVAQDGAHANLNTKLELVAFYGELAEERLVAGGPACLYCCRSSSRFPPSVD